jgi:hypothetical protein
MRSVAEAIASLIDSLLTSIPPLAKQHGQPPHGSQLEIPQLLCDDAQTLLRCGAPQVRMNQQVFSVARLRGEILRPDQRFDQRTDWAGTSSTGPSSFCCAVTPMQTTNPLTGWRRSSKRLSTNPSWNPAGNAVAETGAASEGAGDPVAATAASSRLFRPGGVESGPGVTGLRLSNELQSRLDIAGEVLATLGVGTAYAAAA